MEHSEKQKVAVIGAGLAGCSVAYELSKYSEFDISVFDEKSSVANMASGNYAGILSPNLTSDNNLSDQFHTLGYEVLLDFINNHKHLLDICSTGIVRPLSNENDLARYTNTFKKRQISVNIAVLMDKEAVKKLTNNQSHNPAVYYPNALSLVPKTLCELWLNLSKVNVCLDSKLESISKSQNNKWILDFKDNEQEFDIVVFAGGYDLFKNISQLNKIPTFSSHGQLTMIEKSFDVESAFIDKGYIIPNYNGDKQVIGATFRKNTDSAGEIRASDDDFNISHIKNMLPAIDTNDIQILQSRVGVRCVTSDHLPIIGKIVDYDKFEELFYKPLANGYPSSKMPNIPYEDGMYLASGFGSKGLCSSLLSAKIISASILRKESPISHKLQKSLSPHRFWVRNFKKCIKS